MDSRTYDFKDFTRIEAGGAFRVSVEQSDSFMVHVSADDFSHIFVEKAGNTLVIKRRGFEWFHPFHHRPVATIYMPALTGIDISGASEGMVKDFHADTGLDVNLSGASHVHAYNISAGEVNIKVTGASTLRGDIKAQKDVKFEASGASKVELAGAGANAQMMVSGASKAELYKFPLQNASLDICGASHALVNLNGRLDANVSGASHLYWSGTPTMGNIRTSGASNLGNK